MLRPAGGSAAVRLGAPIVESLPGAIMSDDEFEDDSDELGDEDISEDDLAEDDLDVEDDVVDLDDDTDVAVVVAVEDDVPAPVATAAAVPDVPAPSGDDEEEEALELDEELHPDDVEAPLDALLQERTASATLEDDEEEVEEEEADVDERGEGPTKILPRRPGEFLCASCFLVLPRNQLADEERMLCRDCV